MGCGLQRIDELPIDLKEGACGNFLFDGEERAMLCFPQSDEKKCIRYKLFLITGPVQSGRSWFKVDGLGSKWTVQKTQSGRSAKVDGPEIQK